MTSRIRHLTRLSAYVGAVTVPGLGLLAILAATHGIGERGLQSPEFWLFGLLVIVGELLPIKVPRLRGQDEVTLSATFAYATLLSFGLAPAALALASASLFADVAGRRPPSRAAFNAAQYTLSLSVAAAVLHILGSAPGAASSGAADLPAVLVAATAFFLVNNMLAGVAQALAHRARVLPYLVDDLLFQATTAMILLALAPVVVVVAEASLWLIPLLMLPVLAVHRAGAQAAINAHQALHDSLTGLPNRVLLRNRVTHAIEMAEREGSSVAVLLMDLDRFKEINDTLGHHQGDLLLQEIGPRLASHLRASDTVARLGGDEFAVLLRVEHPGDAQAVAQKLLVAFEEPFVVQGIRLDPGVSIGIACYPEHGADVDTLIQRADVAMYLVKGGGGSGSETYASEYDEYTPERLALVGDLRQAIESGGLVLHYQPKVQVSTGDVTGVEALVRWEHPTRGLVRPDDFIPLAERTGLIEPLTTWVLGEALRQCAGWRKRGWQLTVAVNLSARRLIDTRLPADVARLLRDHDLPSGALTLEITETAIMADPARALLVADQLSAMGVQLSIDDFGTGYSSLAYLKRLPVDEIKIDKSFVLNLTIEQADSAIVRSTIELGHNLGLRVVAEGVETEAIRAELARLDCDVAQGYGHCRPLPPAELECWLNPSESEPAREGALGIAATR